MGATFGDIEDYFSPGLTLTVRGKEYTVPLPSAEVGLWCRTVATTTGELSEASTTEEVQAAMARVEALPKLEGELTLAQRMLGAAYGVMLADKVEDPYVEFCAQTAYIWIIAGEERARDYWEAGGDPNARRRPGNRAARRAAARTGGRSTGAETATQPPASTSGTSSRRRSGRRRTNR